MYRQRPLWRYSFFQVPMVLCIMSLVTALLFGLLGFGRPSVAVAVAIDLSQSTYGAEESFNAQGTILAQEVSAVKEYLDLNSSDLLREPNQIKIFGFAEQVLPLTDSYQTDKGVMEQQLDANLSDPIMIITQVGTGTNLNLAIEEGINSLAPIIGRCRELLVVTDGEVEISQNVISRAISQNVKINSVVISSDLRSLVQQLGSVLGGGGLTLEVASIRTGGIFIPTDAVGLSLLFRDSFFTRFNSNLKWIILWLGLAWVLLMWALILVLDRWIFQGMMKMRMDVSGRLAISNAVFWTVTTPGVIWRIAGGIPFLNPC